MSAQIFQKELTVTASAIDVRNHVNNLQYLQWCLDAAEAHWERNATQSMLKDYVWYVLKHEISYKASAFIDETLRISTWVTYSKGVRSERHYKIERITDGVELVTASTLWCLLDAHTLKPTPVTEEIRNLFEE